MIQSISTRNMIEEASYLMVSPLCCCFYSLQQQLQQQINTKMLLVSTMKKEVTQLIKLASFEILTVLGKALSKPGQTYPIIGFTETKLFLSFS